MFTGKERSVTNMAFPSASLVFVLLPVVMAADRLIQDKTSVTRSKDKPVLFTCKGSTGCNGYIHWYQKKDGEAFKRILYIALGGGNPTKDTGFDRFLAEKENPDTFKLRIPNLQTSDSATYYCACWVSHSDRDATD
ncbi:hypothetical protein JZ751_000741, partial [Albula glossodonta]